MARYLERLLQIDRLLLWGCGKLLPVLLNLWKLANEPFAVT